MDSGHNIPRPPFCCQMEWHRILPNRQQPKFGASESRHLPSRTRDCSRLSCSSSLGVMTGSWLADISWDRGSCRSLFSRKSSLHRSDIQGPDRRRLDHGKSWQQSTGHVRIRHLISDESQHLGKQGRCNGADDGGAVREKPQTDMKCEKSKNKKHVPPPSPCALAQSVPPRLCPFPVHGLLVDIVYAIRASV